MAAIVYEPAGFHDSIYDITERSFMHRLLIGIENSDLPDEEKEREIQRLPQTVWEFWRNDDHGLAHSIKVYERCLEISSACLNIFRGFHGRYNLDNDQNAHMSIRMHYSAEDLNGFFVWSALLHDFYRFLPPHDSFKEHQVKGAHLAGFCFKEDGPHECQEILYDMLARHDYICEIVNKERLPHEFLRNPLAEIFRLADKTSLSPVDEISRYYATGKRLNDRKFFDPELTMEARLNFSNDYSGWDFLNHFLLFFSIQPSDWFYGETREQYRKWQEETEGGKSRALAKIFDMAREEGCSTEDIYQIREVFRSFFTKYGLPDYLC
ncbi:MAG: hypothetical protein WCT26_01410 [Candidatus Buchananbacteria bacterium]|jgi:hypothetical protein